MMKRPLFTICLLLLPVLLFAEIPPAVGEMTLQEKARAVVGLQRKLFPPTNNGIAGRTAPLPQYGLATVALADGTAGVRLSRTAPERSTAFPDNNALASTWDAALAREAGDAVGYEAFGYGVGVMLAPGVNIIRNPLCGRNFEYFSEDPLLTGKLAAAYTDGIQSHGVGACIKHFTCNNQETNRGSVDVRVGDRALREIYLKGFETCIRESHPWAVMSSYNQVNGTPAQEQEWLLTGTLRGEWGFDGIVMTDWSITRHNTAAQIHAGNDLLMPGSERQIEEIVEAVRSGVLPEADLDKAVARLMALSERCGTPREPGHPDLARGAAVAEKAATEGAVLLENNGMLPLPPGGQAALFGVRSYDLIVTGTGSGYVKPAAISQLYEAFHRQGIRTDAELDELYLKYVAFTEADIRLNEKVKIHLGIGLPFLPELSVSRTLIDKAAERNDYAVLTLGRSAGEGVDRTLKDNYYLSDTEKELLRNVCEAFHAKGKKVAVVLNIAGVIEAASWKDLPDAILNIWFPGQEGGAATCALLTGKANPSGRLPVTFARDYFDYPSALDFPYDKPSEGKNYDYTDYSEGIYVGYRHFCTRGIPVCWPFGYGLSYTTFACSGVKVKKNRSSLTVSLTVTNKGDRSGKEAVGIYIGAPSGGLDKPAVELKAFAKTAELAPGASETVSAEIPLSELASFGPRGWETARGDYTLRIGADPTSPQATARISIKSVR